MNRSYLCPKCRNHLKVGDNIVFVARWSNGTKALLLLSPEIGDYRTIHHPSVHIEEGQRLEFLCPICHANLTASELNKNLARIIMIDEDDDSYDIVFSEIAGEKCTFKIGNNKIEQFGKDSTHYTHFFGEQRNRRP